MKEKTIIQIGIPKGNNAFSVYIQNKRTKTTRSLKIEDFSGNLTEDSIKETIANAFGKKIFRQPESMFNRTEFKQPSLKKRQHKMWRPTEDNYLLKEVTKNGRNKENYENIALHLNRDTNAIRVRISSLHRKNGENLKRRWTTEEEKLLVKNHNKGFEELTKLFPQRTKAALMTKISLLMAKIKANPDLIKIWHEEGQNTDIKIKQTR